MTHSRSEDAELSASEPRHAGAPSDEPADTKGHRGPGRDDGGAGDVAASSSLLDKNDLEAEVPESFTDLVGQTHTAATLDPTAEPVLTVSNLKMYFPVKSGGIIRRKVGDVQAVDGVSFEVPEGGSLGLVGESGCGKSTTGRLITRLYEPTGGSMMFKGKDLATLSQKEMLPLRREVQMIFQDPYSSLNPRHTVGTIVGTPLLVHNVVPKKQVLSRVQELLEVVGLNPEHYNRYPSEFSGGQRQRIGIARALALQPKVMVADEPVSALDVSIQAQVINLLQDIQQEFNVAFLFIAHDLAVVRHFCPEVAVMYLGKIVEIGDRESIYDRAHHPYTQALLSAVPDIKQAATGQRRERIRLEGDVPSPINPPSGCRFRTRCPIAQEICAKHEPPLLQIGKRHKVACHFPGELGKHPTEPLTARLLGVDNTGSPDPGASPSKDLVTKPGYDDTWFDLDKRSFGRA
jgi:oligopeptide/dipeptide ABC transporter ATP-binding protein